MGTVSKISRLPAAVREELNQRLFDEQTGTDIILWVNALPEVQAVLTREYGGKPVNYNNLSCWRRRQYAVWLKKHDFNLRIQGLAKLAYELAAATGKSLSETAMAIASGKILEVLEGVKEVMQVEELRQLLESILKMRTSDLAERRFAQELRVYADKIAGQKKENEPGGMVAEDGGLTPEALRRIEEAIGLL